MKALDQALTDHELVKVRLGDSADGDRHALAEALASSVKAELGGVLGRTLLLYRRHPKEPKIVLPKGK